MANKNILTYGAKVSNVELVTYTPVAVRAPFYDTPSATLYSFLAKVIPWDDDLNPPAPTQDQKSIKKTFKNIFAVKKITSNDLFKVFKPYNLTNDKYRYLFHNGFLTEEEIKSNSSTLASKVFLCATRVSVLSPCALLFPVIAVLLFGPFTSSISPVVITIPLLKFIDLKSN